MVKQKSKQAIQSKKVLRGQMYIDGGLCSKVMLVLLLLVAVTDTLRLFDVTCKQVNINSSQW